jgi:tetratricopeptide (TPR) repeat protein
LLKFQILVKIHGKGPDLLVRAHADLGHAYFNFKCPDQAYEHLTIARERNENLTETEQSKEYQLYILKLLSVNRLQDNKPDEAIAYIEEAENICHSMEEEEVPTAGKDLAEIKRYHGEYFTMKKQYREAIDCYQEVIRIFKETEGERSEGEAKACKAIYKVHLKTEDLEQALETLERTISRQIRNRKSSTKM